MENVWLRSSEIETCWAGYQSIIQEECQRFEIVSPPETPRKMSAVEVPDISAALDRHQSGGTSRRSGRDRRAAPVFHKVLP